MIKYIVVALLGIIFTACTSTRAHVSEYRITPSVEVQALNQGQCSQKSIKVAHTFSSDLYRTLEMNYAQGEYKLDTYTQSQWAVSLNRAVNAQLVNMLNASKLFKTVQVAESRTKNDYVLETNIEDFMQYFDEDAQHSVAKVKISMTLIEAKSTKIVASNIFTTEVETQELNAAAGVKALNKALGNVLKESSLWLEAVCQ